MSTPADSTAPIFWRDPALPWVEARAVAGACGIGYARHTHDTFSIGAVMAGRSTYWNGRREESIEAGTVVLINPEEAHACNPKPGLPWSYRMLYLDPAWLARVQGATSFQPYAAMSTRLFYEEFNALYDLLIDAAIALESKEAAALDFFAALDGTFGKSQLNDTDRKLARVADYIEAHHAGALRLDQLCAVAGLSEAHLIRAFKARYGMTPHAWLIDARVRHGREHLRRGAAIAEAAQAAGFADQAHFQRAFKRHVAATPGQYRR